MNLPFENLKFNLHTFKLTEKVLTLTGPDAVTYLNSQTTNNIKNLEIGCFQFNSILDLAGKLISSFIVMKSSENELLILLKESSMNSTIDRIEKYHISEDFEINVSDQEYFLETNSRTSEGFRGKYFFENDKIVTKKSNVESSKDKFNKLKVLTGVPEFGVEVLENELINNTFLDELSVDYKKGCYPGQETVAKIDSRRGAAYKPVLIVCSKKIENLSDTIIKQDNKKIGYVLNYFTEDESVFLMVSLSRVFRIDKSEIEFEIDGELFNGQVNYYPYIATTNHLQSIELYDYAVELFHQGNNEEAIKYFYKAIDKNPNHEDAYESLGVLYGRIENYPKAIELMEQLKEINPKCMMALTNLSLYHMKIGNIDIAEKFKADATILNFSILGDEAEQKRKIKEVEERRLKDRDRREGMFLQVLEMDSEDAMANNGMGEIMFEKERYDVAIEFFKQAIKANKKYSVAYLGLGKAHLKLNQVDLAKDVFKTGIEVAGKNGDLMPANEMQSLSQKI